MALKQMEAKKVTVGENSFHIKPFPAFKAANLRSEGTRLNSSHNNQSRMPSSA